ncbi:MAG TPA: hypothetical protein VFI76_06180 [Terrimicrobiaceae bacterium]|nr:hypothetical protein [Terrimicrobiaceae bacterium]
MHNYVWINRFIRFGKPLAWVVGLAVPLLALWGVLAAGLPWVTFGVGVAVGVLAGFFILVFAELTHVIADMLLPR